MRAEKALVTLLSDRKQVRDGVQHCHYQLETVPY